MVLEKMGTKKRYEIYKGSKLDVRIKDDSFYSRIMILGFTDSAIRLQERLLPMKDITAVDVSSIKKPSFKKTGTHSNDCGGGFIAYRSFQPDGSPEWFLRDFFKGFYLICTHGRYGPASDFCKKRQKEAEGLVAAPNGLSQLGDQPVDCI